MRSFITYTAHQILGRWAGSIARVGEMRNAYSILFEKTRGEETT